MSQFNFFDWLQQYHQSCDINHIHCNSIIMLNLLAAYTKSSVLKLLFRYWCKEEGIQVSMEFQHHHLEVSIQCWSVDLNCSKKIKWVKVKRAFVGEDNCFHLLIRCLIV